MVWRGRNCVLVFQNKTGRVGKSRVGSFMLFGRSVVYLAVRGGTQIEAGGGV